MKHDFRVRFFSLRIGDFWGFAVYAILKVLYFPEEPEPELRLEVRMFTHRHTELSNFWILYEQKAHRPYDLLLREYLSSLLACFSHNFYTQKEKQTNKKYNNNNSKKSCVLTCNKLIMSFRLTSTSLCSRENLKKRGTEEVTSNTKYVQQDVKFIYRHCNITMKKPNTN